MVLAASVVLAVSVASVASAVLVALVVLVVLVALVALVALVGLVGGIGRWVQRVSLLTVCRATIARPASSRATGTRNGEHET